MAIQFSEAGIRASGRASGGVRGIMLDGPDDRVVAVDTVTDAASDLLVVSERGMGKRTPMSAYRSQSRGGKGLKTMNLTEKTGSLVASCVISRENQNNLRLVIVTAQGIGIRMIVSEVKTTDGRSTQGVKLINLADGDHVRTVEYMDVIKNEIEAE
jgi:DNA gyrase subunit A